MLLPRSLPLVREQEMISDNFLLQCLPTRLETLEHRGTTVHSHLTGKESRR